MDTYPRIDSEDVKYIGKFVQYKVVHWTDAKGMAHTWEVADRVANRGAVMIIAKLVPSNRYVLIRQYRPPVRRQVVEFPAGLMDGDETPEQSARRELKEETGFIAKKITIHPPAYTTPGLANESVYVVEVEIDENAPENRNPETKFDASESIVTLLVNESELGDFYRRQTADDVSFDAKLAAFILARYPGQ